MQNQTHAALEQLRGELKASSTRSLRNASAPGRPAADLPSLSPLRVAASRSVQEGGAAGGEAALAGAGAEE